MLRRIDVHPLCYLVALLSILTGYFTSFLIYTVLLLVHELGHFLTAHLIGWKIDEIKFYPYGGLSVFQEAINRPLKEELWILMMGPLSQIIFFLLICRLPFSSFVLDQITTYHYSILLFNLLPIYPLDGGKLLQIFFSYHMAYRKSIYWTIKSSFVVLIVLFFMVLPMGRSFHLFCLFLLLLSKLLEERKQRNFYYEKFLLERYLHRYTFSKLKVIKDPKEMRRDFRHLIKKGDHYYLERDFLKKKYKNLHIVP